MANARCPACGAVNYSEAGICRRCRRPLGGAGGRQRAAPERSILGPVFTEGGFKAWHFVCLADVLVAVPLGRLASFAASAAAAGPLLGGLGDLLQERARRDDGLVKKALEAMPEARLRAAGTGHEVFPVARLASIRLQRPAGSSPEIELAVRGAPPRLFGVTNAEQFSDIAAALQRAYPGLYVRER
jgi:hypothetical protein